MALVEGAGATKGGGRKDADVVLGDDWVAPEKTVESEVRNSQERRGLFSLNRSPLTRKIITFNLVALNFLVAGILFLNSSRDTLAEQKTQSVEIEAELIADVFEAKAEGAVTVNLGTGEGLDVGKVLQDIDVRPGLRVLSLMPLVFLSVTSMAALIRSARSVCRKSRRSSLISC
jgi:two-component system sensor histidine kinase ChvG